MSALSYEQIAAAVLAEVRAIYPNARKPDPGITEAWARVIARSHQQLPASVWREAVTLWSVSHRDPPSPHDLIDSVKQVVGQWNNDPVKKEQLAEFRARRIDARLGSRHGAMDALEGVRRVQGEITSGGDEQPWRETRAEIVRRARANKQQRMTEATRGDLFVDMNKQPGDRQEEG